MADVSSLGSIPYRQRKMISNILWPILYSYSRKQKYPLPKVVSIITSVLNGGNAPVAVKDRGQVPPLLPWFLQLGPAMAAADDVALLGEDSRPIIPLATKAEVTGL